MRKAFDDLRALLGAYPSSTVMGISVLAGSLTGWLLEQLTWRQALAGAVSGLVAILVKQVQAGTVAANGAPPSAAPRGSGGPHGGAVAAKVP